MSQNTASPIYLPFAVATVLGCILVFDQHLVEAASRVGAESMDGVLIISRYIAIFGIVLHLRNSPFVKGSDMAVRAMSFVTFTLGYSITLRVFDMEAPVDSFNWHSAWLYISTVVFHVLLGFYHPHLNKANASNSTSA